MTTTDLGEYFKDFNPVSCEWCDGKSANIVWGLDASAAKAMCYLSRPIGKTNYFNYVGILIKNHFRDNVFPPLFYKTNSFVRFLEEFTA